ncbi:MAG: protein kinase [Deltaproteobacteria bacterium]|nr:protein kinase [Deltaproteobacteria bacterium]
MADEIICSKCSAPNPKDTVFCGKCGERMPGQDAGAEEKDPLLGAFVGDRFLVHEQLGEGGMGVVYRAEQTAIGRTVALKVLHSHLTRDDSLHARFHNEAAASSRLTHPNTVTIYDFGKTDLGSLYIAMEFVEGKSLDDEIREGGALEWLRACRLAIQICGSLRDAHDNSIVHRDLKPENVMLCDRGGETDVVKVLDFGIAKILEDDGTDQRQALTKTGMVFGTPQYMSPEQIRGEQVDHRTDIYSLGVILYQMLAGVLPFTADMPMGVLSKHLMDVPPPFTESRPGSNIPEAVEAVVMSTLAKGADDRPQSMKELADALLGAADITGTTSMTTGGQLPATLETPSPATASKKADTPPPTDVHSKGAAVAPAPAKKGGAGVAIIIAVVVVLLGGGAAGWYFLAGPGASAKKPSPYASHAGVAPPPPPVNQQIAPAPTPTQQPGPAQLPTNATGPGPAPLPAHPETDSDVDEDKGKGGKSSKTKAKKKDVSCDTTGQSDPIADAIRKQLKSKSARITKCLKNNGAGKADFSFRVLGGKSRPDKVKVKKSLGGVSNCLSTILREDFGKTDKAMRNGDASFNLSKLGGVVKTCNVQVDARKRKKSGASGVKLIGKNNKKIQPGKKKVDKKPGKKQNPLIIKKIP